MISQKNRLTKDKEFDYVFKKGRSCYNKILGVKVAVNNLQHNRFGVIVSTKISKKATERNKIKRRIKAEVNSQSDKLKKGYDIVLISLADIKNKNYQDIKHAISQSFKKLELYL